MKKVLSYLKPYWFIAIWSPIFMVGEVLIDLELPTVMAQIVNEGIIRKYFILLVERIIYELSRFY